MGYFKLTWMKIRLFQKEFPDKEDKEKKKKKEAKKEEKEQKFNINRLPKIITLLCQSSPYLMRVFNAFLKSITFKRFILN